MNVPSTEYLKYHYEGDFAALLDLRAFEVKYIYRATRRSTLLYLYE